jgi:hypothetical protein
MDDRKTLLRLSPVTDVALVDSLRHREGGRLEVEAFPSKSEQLARTEGVGHVKLKQNAISKRELREGQPELIPSECCGVRRSQLCRYLDLACRVLNEEVLIDCLGKDVPKVCTHLQDAIL